MFQHCSVPLSFPSIKQMKLLAIIPYSFHKQFKNNDNILIFLILSHILFIIRFLYQIPYLQQLQKRKQYYLKINSRHEMHFQKNK